MNLEPKKPNSPRRTPNSPARLCFLAAMAAGILGAFNGAAQTNTDSGPGFDSFNIITRNNIFNPNRSPGYVYTHHTHTPAPVVDAFALVGTMSYPKGKFAFFDGSSSAYKKVLEPGATIAGYTVKNVTQQAVILAANGKEFEMKVGTQLRKEADNQWRLSDYSGATASPVDTGESTTVQSAAPPTGASPEANDVLKRLMQQRQQELK